MTSNWEGRIDDELQGNIYEDAPLIMIKNSIKQQLRLEKEHVNNLITGYPL